MHISTVIAGLDPAIHDAAPQGSVFQTAFIRQKPSWMRGSSPRMTAE
jgi:hypothetical protein